MEPNQLRKLMDEEYNQIREANKREHQRLLAEKQKKIIDSRLPAQVVESITEEPQMLLEAEL